METEELKEILECEVITDFTPEENFIPTNSVGCNAFDYNSSHEDECLNLESNDFNNSDLEDSEGEQKETYDNDILMNRIMSDATLKSYYDLFHKESFLCNLITRLEDVQLLNDFYSVSQRIE